MQIHETRTDGTRGFMEALTHFLKDFKRPILDLELNETALKLLLVRYGSATRYNQSFRSSFDFGVSSANTIAVKLVYDREHLINALVPKADEELRSKLHKIRAAKEKLYFARLQSGEDYQLSNEGRRFDNNHRKASRKGHFCVMQ